jgi:hypothetical protein
LLKPQLQLVHTTTTPKAKRKGSKQQRPLPPADAFNYAKVLRYNKTYLQSLLPPSSLGLYTPQRYGNHLGIPIVCPTCEVRPPSHVKGYARWRWMSFHIATEHRRSR